jgi:hypothetical protein
MYSIALVVAGALGLLLRETRGANIELNIDESESGIN